MNKSLFLLLLLIPVNLQAATITLTVTDFSGISRSGQYVSYAVPLAQSDNVTSISGMEITTDSSGVNTVDAQFDIISRYDDEGDGADSGDPIRTVLCTFKVTVTASSYATYYLQTSGGSGNASGSNLATDETGYIEVDTTKILARISETVGNVFDYAIIDTDNDGSYADETAIISSPTDDGFFVQSDEDGASKLYSSNLGDTPTVTIHYNGPLMALVSVSGNFKNGSTYLKDPLADGKAEYKIFYKFFKDTDYVKLNATFKAENHFGSATSNSATTNENIDIDYAYLRTSLNSFTPTAVNFSSGISGNDCADTTSPSGTYSVLQSHADNNTSESDAEDTPNFSYSITNCTGTTSGTRFDGWAGMDDGSRGLSVASRWFWQKWPKGIDVDATNDRIDFFLWPDETIDYIFLGASWRTYEMIYRFGTSSDVDTSLAQLKRPLRIVPSNLYTSNFFDILAPTNITTNVTFNGDSGQTLQPAIDKWQEQAIGHFDNSYVDVGYDIADAREGRGDTWLQGYLNGQPVSWYGWRVFGDTVREGNSWGFGSQCYNWSYLAIINGLRHNNYQAFELGDEMVRQYADAILYHDVGSTTQVASSTRRNSASFHGGAKPEADTYVMKHNFEYIDATNQPEDYSHNWPHGVALQYMMTGDPFYKDALDDITQHIEYNYSNIPAHYTQTDVDKICNDTHNCYNQSTKYASSREYTRAIAASIVVEAATGDNNLLDIADGIFTNAVLWNEVGTTGTLNFSLSDAWMFYEAIKTKPLIYLYNSAVSRGNTTISSNVAAFLSRAATWVKDSAFNHWATYQSGTYGTGANDGKYMPMTVQGGYYYNATPWTNGTGDHTYAITFSDLFAFMYNQTGTQSWLDLARVTFRDSLVYGTTATMTPINTSTSLSSTTQITSFPPGETWLKIGKVLEKPMYYLNTEWRQQTQTRRPSPWKFVSP